LPKVVTQQRRGRASNPRLLDRKSDALPLSHRATHPGLYGEPKMNIEKRSSQTADESVLRRLASMNSSNDV